MAESLKLKQLRLKRQVIDEWRGLKSPRQGRPVKLLSQEVAVALEKLGVGAALSEEDMLKAWNEIMPPVISGNTKPTGFKNGILEVSVLQPSIHYTLDRQMKPDIVKRLQSLFGRKKVKGLKFRIG